MSAPKVYRVCKLCHGKVETRRVKPHPAVKGAVEVSVGKCPTCDVRQCGARHCVTDPRANSCPTCGVLL